MGPLGVNDDIPRFPGKRNPSQTRFFFKFIFIYLFFISIAKWSIGEDDAIMSKVADGKGKTRGKNEKTAKSAEEQDNELTDSYQNCDLSWYLHKEKETSF